MHNKKIMIVAGESSGDNLGASIMQQLNSMDDYNIVYIGVGGINMQSMGLSSIFPMKEISVMGLFEVIPSIPKILRHLSTICRTILYEKPDIIITIDAPGFNFRFIKKIKKYNLDIPLVHIVAPTVWAWKEYRAKKISILYDHLLVLLPFEKKYFTKYNLKTTFIGHPLIEKKSFKMLSAFKNKYNKKKNNIISIFPGSRVGEVKRHLEIIINTIDLFIRNYPNTKILCLAATQVKDIIQEKVKKFPHLPIHILDESKYKQEVLLSTNIALAVSGTISLELAATNTPMIVLYKFNTLSYFLIKRLVKIKYASLVNILLQKEVIPEFIQDRASEKLLAKELINLFESKLARETQIKYFKKAIKMLSSYKHTPSQLAKEEIIKMLMYKK